MANYNNFKDAVTAGINNLDTVTPGDGFIYEYNDGSKTWEKMGFDTSNYDQIIKLTTPKDITLNPTGSGKLYINPTTTIESSVAITWNVLGNNINLSTDNTFQTNITSTKEATNTSTASLVISGGVGIAKKLFIGTDLSITGNIITQTKITDSTNSTNLSTGSLRTAGGFAVSRDSYFGGIIYLPKTTSTVGQIKQILSGTTYINLIHTYSSGATTSNYYIGQDSGNFTNSGTENIGIGISSLSALTSGAENICIGSASGTHITTGQNNISIGVSSLSFITNSNQNVAIGGLALNNCTIPGSVGNNVGVGYSAGQGITTGYSNTMIGFSTTTTTTATFCTALGAQSDASAHPGGAITLGRLGTDQAYCTQFNNTSDIRLKDEIEEIPIGLNFIMKLSPVQYKWKDKKYKINNETTSIIHKRKNYGFIAQEVKKVMDDFKIDFSGYRDAGIENGINKEININYDDFKIPQDIKTLDYSQFIPICVKAIQEQQDIINDLKKQIDKLNKDSIDFNKILQKK